MAMLNNQRVYRVFSIAMWITGENGGEAVKPRHFSSLKESPSEPVYSP